MDYLLVFPIQREIRFICASFWIRNHLFCSNLWCQRQADIRACNDLMQPAEHDVTIDISGWEKRNVSGKIQSRKSGCHKRTCRILEICLAGRLITCRLLCGLVDLQTCGHFTVIPVLQPLTNPFMLCLVFCFHIPDNLWNQVHPDAVNKDLL